METDLSSYADYLRREGIMERTIVEYVRHVQRGLAANDMAAPLRAAKSASSWQGAFAAAWHYGEYTGQGDLRPQLRKEAPCPKRRPKETQPVREEDWRKIVTEVAKQPDPYRAVLEVLLTSGLRINDVLRITREAAEDIVRYGSTRIVQKGGSEREWAPSARIAAPLQRLLTKDWKTLQDLVAGHWKTAQNRLRKALSILCENAGIPYANPHRYRHTMATEMNERQVDPRTMQKVLGHASLQTTMKYVHPSTRLQRKATDVVLDDIFGDGKSRR